MVEPEPTPGSASHFLYMGDVPELASGGALSIDARFPTCHPLCDRHSEMCTDLLVEIRIAVPGGAAHGVRSAGGSSSAPIASDNCSHRLRSAASCLRPAAVSRYSRTR